MSQNRKPFALIFSPWQNTIYAGTLSARCLLLATSRQVCPCNRRHHCRQSTGLHVSIHRCCLLARELYMYMLHSVMQSQAGKRVHGFGSRVCSAPGRQAQGIRTFRSYPTVKRPMNHPARFLKQCLKKWLHHEKVEFAMIRKSPSANANMSTISPLHRFPCASAQIVCRTP